MLAGGFFAGGAGDGGLWGVLASGKHFPDGCFGNDDFARDPHRFQTSFANFGAERPGSYGSVGEEARGGCPQIEMMLTP